MAADPALARGYGIGPEDIAAFAALDADARRAYIETPGGLEAWLANRAAQHIPHTDDDAVRATLDAAYGEPDPADDAMAAALRSAFHRTLDPEPEWRSGRVSSIGSTSVSRAGPSRGIAAPSWSFPTTWPTRALSLRLSCAP